MNNIPFEISCASINKLQHKLNYSSPIPTYDLAIEFILERLTRRMNWLHSSTIIVLESRGEKEDRKLLKTIVSLLENGNKYISSDTFSCIKGIYFNTKWTTDRHKSYWPLEISDIVSYSIHQHVLNNETEIYESIKQKIIGYPQITGKGLKTFP